MTFPVFSVQLLIETKCVRFFDIESFDGRRGTKASCPLARHRFALFTQPMQNMERQRVVQPVCEGVRRTFDLPMRQVTA